VIFSFFKSPKIKINAQKNSGLSHFAGFTDPVSMSGHLGALFACQKVVF
jgi:hypothetical protein